MTLFKPVYKIIDRFFLSNRGQPLKARYYQRDGVSAALNHFSAGVVSTMLEMATGTGKTICFGSMCQFIPGRVLILAHRDELITQALDKVGQMVPHAKLEREQGTEWKATVGRGGGRIVIASKDTLCKPSRLHRFPREEFDLVVVDEGHHLVRKNATYWRIIKRFVAPPIGEGTAKLLLVTATSERGDGEALGYRVKKGMGQGIVQTVAYRYPIWQGIDDGYLVPIFSHTVHVAELDYQLSTATNEEGEKDIAPGDLERICGQDKYIHTVVGPTVDMANKDGKRRSTCIFMPNVPSAKRARDIINLDYGGRAICVTGDMDPDERKTLLEDYHRGRYQHVVNCDVLTEGWDSYRVEIVVPKPTQAWGKFVQMIGRGTRPWEGCVDVWGTAQDRRLAIAHSPKPRLTVLDPCGVSHQHKLRNAVDIFAGVYSPEVLDIARDLARASKEQMDATEVIKAAQEERRMRESIRRSQIITRCQYGLTDVDLFDYYNIKKPWTPHKLYGKPATEGQVDYLERLGIRVAPGLKFFDAKVLIDGIKKQRNAEPATEGQRRVLVKFGLSPDLTKGEATEKIEAIKANGWKILNEVQ